MDVALDYEILEDSFWSMTLAELERLVLSKKRQLKVRLQEKAYFDYNLANLIGLSVSRLYSKSNKMPEIEKVYPKIFENAEKIEEEKQKLADEKSALNFKTFADSFNAKRGAKKNE